MRRVISVGESLGLGIEKFFQEKWVWKFDEVWKGFGLWEMRDFLFKEWLAWGGVGREGFWLFVFMEIWNLKSRQFKIFMKYIAFNENAKTLEMIKKSILRILNNSLFQ